MRIQYFIILLLSSILVWSQQPTREQIKEVEQARKEVKSMKGKPFPPFKLVTLGGDNLSSEDIKGKIVLFNFWFTSCRPCIQEMPELNEMVEEFINEEVLFIAATFNESQQVRRFLKRFEFEYDIVPDVKDFCLELNIRNYPTHFVIGRDGIIKKVMIGYSEGTVDALRKSLKKLLNKN